MTTKNDMMAVLGLLQGLQPWADYSIGYTPCGQLRLERKRGALDVSPCGTKKEVTQFMRAMISAIDTERTR